MTDYEILDKNTDVNGNATSYLVFFPESGETDMITATPENVLLFEHEMYDFINGEELIELSEDSPELYVASMETTYILIYNGETIEVPPRYNHDFLQGVKTILDTDNLSKITELYEKVIANQVRKNIINSLDTVFGEEGYRITKEQNGWLIDDYILVDWMCNIYTKDDDPEEGDHVRQGGEVVKTDKSYELIQLRQSHDVESETVTIGGKEFLLSEKEMMFLAKVEFLLNRRKYHPDQPFWDVIDRHTTTNSDSDSLEDDPNVPNF